MRVQRCKGTRDLSPAEMAVFRFIEDTFRQCCLGWGYGEVRTPTLEYLHLFTATGTLTPSRLGRAYSFLDWDGWSGERVVLRPDGTIPVARLYSDSMADRDLARLFYVANVFIFEETGKQNRERWQGGAEIIGVSSPQADVELVMLALEVMRRLGISGVKLNLFHAGIIRGLLQGLDPEAQIKLFDGVLDGDAEALRRIKAQTPVVEKALSLLELKGRSPGFLKNLKALLKADLPGLRPAIDDFIAITRLLESLGCDYQIDIASGRGFEYYTGLIFQFLRDGEKLGGGGRYDALIPLMGGKDTPASGLALYLDRMMELVRPAARPAAPVVLVRAEVGREKEGFNIGRRLCQAGYTAEFDLGVPGPADPAWTLDVRGETPLFLLRGGAETERLETDRADDVLSWLEARRGG